MQRIKAGHIEIAYLDDSPGEEDAAATGVLLWLHGGFVSHRAWQPQREYFQHSAHASWRHIYVDLCGHGESTRDPAHYDVECFALDMWALLDALHIERVVCVGHSLGGMVAQSMARQSPHRIAGVVLADTTYSTQSTLYEGAQTLLARAMFRVLSVERIAKMSASQLAARRPDVGPMIFHEMMAHSDDRDAFFAMWDAVFAFDSRDWLSLLECPVLLLLAEDNKATRAQRKGFVERIPHIEVIEIPHSGHMLGWDNPDAFNLAVEAFATRIFQG